MPTLNLKGMRLPKTKVKLTPAQKQALADYMFAEKQEDRLAGSVFANARNTAEKTAITQAAYQRCKALGMTHEHGI